MSSRTDTTAEKINFAIQDCLSECTGSNDPLGCLAGFLEQLRELQQWPEAEIFEVDNAVRHLLLPVLGKAPHAPKSGDQAKRNGSTAAIGMDQLRPD